MKILTKLLTVISTLMLVACASSGSNIAVTKSGAKLDRAKFDDFIFTTTFSDASHVICDYGKERIADFDVGVPPEHKTWGGGTHGTWAFYPKMRCSWLAADGTPQVEVVKMDKVLLPQYVEWEHFAGEELVEDEPLQLGRVLFTIRINDKQLSIIRGYKVQLYGERLSETERRVKAVEVKQVIYERK